ncbi:HNH endonuclease [Arthrobacter sp. NPDC056493]|uniref:HNH endonuclease n=1 Tax=Arthrobacter sp. NPDC056493 TaxID=3345839 RepID=UPI003672EF15
MTDEMWANWDWPPDHEKIPSNKRKTALILWRRDGNICQVCGLRVDIGLRNGHPGMASIDHINPVRRYAPASDVSNLNVWGNIRLAHLNCNTAHADFDPRLIALDDYRQMLRKAIDEFERQGIASPPKTAMTRRETPYVTPAWELEQRTGRPAGTFGEEWTTKG